MGSFANFRRDSANRAAGQALNIDLREASRTRQGRQNARTEINRYRSGTGTGTGTGTGAGTGAGTGTQGGSQSSFQLPGTAGADYFAVAGNIYSNLANQPWARGNEVIGNQIAGGILDTAGTLTRLGAENARQTSFFADLGKFDQDRRAGITADTQRLMGVESALSNESYRVQGDEMRKVYETQGQQDRLSRQTQGEQDRLGKQEEGNQSLRLRADARGAVERQGARFYG